MAKIKGLTDIIVILDRSGSMSAIHSGTVEGLIGFIRDQRKVPGEARFTLVQFDDRSIDKVYDRVPIDTVPDGIILEPRGGTPLLDAVGKTLSAFKSNAEKVIFLIVTDGAENASVEYTIPMVKALIEKQQGKGRQVIYLAANIDAFDTGHSYGIRTASIRNYQYTDTGTEAGFRNVSSSITNYRTGITETADFDSEVPETIS